ncbi:MAG: hypothetical protein ACOCQR_01745 [bacterium]
MKINPIGSDIIFKHLSKDKPITIFIRMTNCCDFDEYRDIIRKSLQIEDEVISTILAYKEYIQVELDNKEEAYKLLMKLSPWKNKIYATLYIDGKFEDENT